MHTATGLLAVLIVFLLPSRAAQIPASAAVAEAEAIYADLADSYGIISTIDSDLFATYQGKDRTGWERVYGEKRKQLTEKLSKISASSLSPIDARALEVMNRHLRENFPEQFSDQNAPPEHCQDAQRQNLSLESIEGALHSCFTERANNIDFEGKHFTRVSAMDMLEVIGEEERRKKLFYAFEPLWSAVNGKNDGASPYRRLLPIAVSAAEGQGTRFDAAAKTIGVSSHEVEHWLEQILDTWSQVDAGQMVEPWNYYYRGGEASRLLSSATPKDSFVSVNQRYYRDLGADLQQLGVLYDLEARPGKAPLAYTDFVTRGRFVDGKWRASVVHISGSYATGGLGLLDELVHENGHAVYEMAMRARPAFMDVTSPLFDEAFADVPGWNTYEPAWQRKYLGQAASVTASLRDLFSYVMLDVAWSLFECRMLRDPAADPNAVWTEITSRYLHIVRHPEISWWAMRGQLVQMPGYMVNYGLGSVLTADIREHTREVLGPFETGNPHWYSWTSEHLLRFGEELDTSTLLKQFLGRSVSPQALLTQIRRIAPAARTASDDLWPTKGWATASPTSVGLDERVFNALDKDFRGEKFLLMDSFVVFRCGKKVYERTYAHDYARIYGKQAKEKGPLNQRQKGPYNYFDPYWHPYYHGTDMHSMQSVTKTITSVIIGVAKTRGDFKAGLDTPVLKYFDASKVKNVDERKRRMTLHDLLTMTAGLEWNEDLPDNDPRNDMSRMEGTDDWVQYAIDKPMAEEPGKSGNYNSGATELLAYIFQKETGQDIEDYGEKYLFSPLGIKHYWKRTYLGVVDTEGGLFLSASDLAKIGYLYLQAGVWEGRQIVSKDWVMESVKPSLDVDRNVDYGFLWWLQKRADSSEHVWMARGFGQQHLMVFPQEKLIAVFTGWRLLGKEAEDYEADEKEFAQRILTGGSKQGLLEDNSERPTIRCPAALGLVSQERRSQVGFAKNSACDRP